MRELLQNLHEQVIVKMVPVASYVPMELVYIGGALVAGAVILGWMSVIAMLWIYLERRVAGYIQIRYGPNRVGPFGLLQSLADGIKLLAKEDIVPRKADRFLYELAPVLVFAGAFLPFVALPFSQHLVIADMDLGIFFILTFGALEVIGILMAGWAPGSKWTLYGGMRLAAQMLAYEIPLGLSVLTVVALAGTLNLTDMVLWQTKGLFILDNVNTWWIFDFLNWSIFRAPWVTLPAFLIFYVASLAETKRAPFDLPEAESELVSGFHTEYTGIRFSYFFLAEYCAMYVVSVLGAVVFLGGWHWPFPTTYEVSSNLGVIDFISKELTDKVHYVALPSLADGVNGEVVKAALTNVWEFIVTLVWTGPWATVRGLFGQGTALKGVINEAFGFANLLGKSFFLLFVMLWLRWTLPRVRIDQVMHMCLKVLLPAGLGLILLATITAAMSAPYGGYDIRKTILAELRADEPAAVEAAAAEATVGEGAAQPIETSESEATSEAAPAAEAKTEAAASAPAAAPAPAAPGGPRVYNDGVNEQFDNQPPSLYPGCE